MDLITNHYEWIFSGIGVFILASLLAWKSKASKDGENHMSNSNSINIHINNTKEDSNTENYCGDLQCLEGLKSKTHILFIDDKNFTTVIKILKKMGWKHVSCIEDVKSLDDSKILESDIIFVDIQGVGKALGFREEGLGLASALKSKYPKKKIVIYSAERNGNRFHQALKEVDDFLAKDAEPYEFGRVIEKLASEISK